MKYNTIETSIIPVYSERIKYAAEFAAIEQELRYIKEKLGDDFICEDKIKPATMICKCPYCNKINRVFITDTNRSTDNTRRIIGAKCVNCTKRFLVYQESGDE